MIMEDSSADQTMRSAVLMVGVVCLLAAAATVFRAWPDLSYYPFVLAGVGIVFLALYKFASVETCRKICLVVSFGTWR
jgi:hypothetical protein